MKKKKFKFDVVFELRELTNVSLASGLLFSKLRLLDGGKFTETCYRVDVSNNRVKWQQTFNFSCKMTANTNTGVLDPCFCRISVRKETKGGKSYEKLGFVDINMAEFAGQNKRTRKYLLEGHDEKLNRQDNSILEVRISMILRQGDPLFKLPTVQNPHSTLESPSSKGEPSCGQEDGLGLPSNNLDEHGAGAVTSGSGTPSSQSSHASTSLDGDNQTITKLALAEGSNIVTGKALGHHRSASEPPLTKDVLQTGQLSEGYGSMTTQSTSSSSDAGRRFNSIERTPSKYQRSRVDPGNVVEQIINSQEDESSRSNNHDQNNVATFGFAQDGMSGLMISDFGLESEDKYRTL